MLKRNSSLAHILRARAGDTNCEGPVETRKLNCSQQPPETKTNRKEWLQHCMYHSSAGHYLRGFASPNVLSDRRASASELQLSLSHWLSLVSRHPVTMQPDYNRSGEPYKWLLDVASQEAHALASV